jgi:hypothetical protein
MVFDFLTRKRKAINDDDDDDDDGAQQDLSTAKAVKRAKQRHESPHARQDNSETNVRGVKRRAVYAVANNHYPPVKKRKTHPLSLPSTKASPLLAIPPHLLARILLLTLPDRINLRTYVQPPLTRTNRQLRRQLLPMVLAHLRTQDWEIPLPYCLAPSEAQAIGLTAQYAPEGVFWAAACLQWLRGFLEDDRVQGMRTGKEIGTTGTVEFVPTILSLWPVRQRIKAKNGGMGRARLRYVPVATPNLGLRPEDGSDGARAYKMFLASNSVRRIETAKRKDPTAEILLRQVREAVVVFGEAYTQAPEHARRQKMLVTALAVLGAYMTAVAVACVGS